MELVITEETDITVPLLSQKEIEIINKYRLLTPAGKKFIEEIKTVVEDCKKYHK